MPPTSQNIGLLLPSRETIKNHIQLPIFYNFDKLITEAAETLKEMYLTNGLTAEGGVIFDEIELKQRVDYAAKMSLIVGTKKGILEKDIKNVKRDEIAQEIADKVMQIFFVSNCGTINLPLGYFPTKVNFSVFRFLLKIKFLYRD